MIVDPKALAAELMDLPNSAALEFGSVAEALNLDAHESQRFAFNAYLFPISCILGVFHEELVAVHGELLVQELRTEFVNQLPEAFCSLSLARVLLRDDEIGLVDVLLRREGLKDGVSGENPIPRRLAMDLAIQARTASMAADWSSTPPPGKNVYHLMSASLACETVEFVGGMRGQLFEIAVYPYISKMMVEIRSLLSAYQILE